MCPGKELEDGILKQFSQLNDIDVLFITICILPINQNSNGLNELPHRKRTRYQQRISLQFHPGGEKPASRQAR